MPYFNFFSALRDTITAFAVSGGYFVLFSVTFLEGIPLLGIAIPGHIALISAGFLVSTGTLNVWIVVVVSVVAAILGDFLSYMLGRKFGWPLLEKLLPYFFISDSIVSKAKKFLETHTGKALVIGRFNPVTRGLMPFIIGAGGMRPKLFWIWNSIGAMAWVIASILIGYALGFGFNFISSWISRALLATIIAIGLIVWGYRFVNIRFHVFRKYELFVLGLNLCSLVIFVRMLDDALQIKPFMAGFDLYINSFFYDTVITSSTLGHWFLSLASWIDALGGIIVLSIVTIIWGIALTLHKKWRSVSILLMTMGSTAFVVGLAKNIIMRVRPDNLVIPETWDTIQVFFYNQSIYFDPSFPSGHSAFAAAFFTILAYLVVPKIKSWIRRELFIVFTVIIILIVGLSRLVLSVHWASDVIAGWSLGIFCATASILFVRYIGAMLENRFTRHLERDVQIQKL